MTIYQCFFFSDGRIRYWENLERETASSLRTLLTRRLAKGVLHLNAILYFQRQGACTLP
jgi:hypothetical protein